MFRPLKSWLKRGFVDPAQMTLELPNDRVTRSALGVAEQAPAPRATRDALPAQFLARLRALGLRRINTLRLTRNRNVVVSFRGEEMRVQVGFADAPDDVLRALVQFVEGRTRAERRAAQRVIVSYPLPIVAGPARASRRERTLPEDEPLAARLAAHHAQLNARHFSGSLKSVPIRVSRRMKRRLGHYSLAADGAPAEIAISWRHLRRNGWAEALDTLLHEMVHQWQDESGLPIDHGRAFRQKAREVGIVPAARRAVR